MLVVLNIFLPTVDTYQLCPAEECSINCTEENNCSSSDPNTFSRFRTMENTNIRRRKQHHTEPEFGREKETDPSCSICFVVLDNSKSNVSKIKKLIEIRCNFGWLNVLGWWLMVNYIKVSLFFFLRKGVNLQIRHTFFQYVIC